MNNLWVEKDLRAVLVQDAVSEAQKAPPRAATNASAADEARLDGQIRRHRNELLKVAPKQDVRAPFGTMEFAWQAAGWLLTALAGMLGAPFWFELLQRLVNLRGVGPKPETARGLMKNSSWAHAET